MIITRTPYRISFMGGGTDYPAWYREHGGEVLATTIDKYCYISARYMPAFLGTKYRVFWSQMEAVDRLEDIQHAGVRGCLEYLKMDDGIEVNHAGDLPARSGLGSSSAFTVGMLSALHILKRNFVSKDDIAAEAIAVEQDVLKETVGIQDQIQCAHGGLNRIRIERSGEYQVEPVSLLPDVRRNFENSLMLFFTGLQRHASEIAAEQIKNAHRRQAELHQIAGLVQPAHKAVVRGDFQEFGRLLHEGWMLKRRLSDKVSSYDIDAIYNRARQAGATGGKILGAGGGGFMLFSVPEDRREDVRLALADLLSVPVKFESNGTETVLAA